MAELMEHKVDKFECPFSFVGEPGASLGEQFIYPPAPEGEAGSRGLAARFEGDVLAPNLVKSGVIKPGNTKKKSETAASSLQLFEWPGEATKQQPLVSIKLNIFSLSELNCVFYKVERADYATRTFETSAFEKLHQENIRVTFVRIDRDGGDTLKGVAVQQYLQNLKVGVQFILERPMVY